MPIQSNQPESVTQRRKTGVFVETSSESPYCTMGHVFSRSWHSCKLICKRSLSIHNSSYWWVNDIWPSEDSPVEVGPTECSRHLEIWSSLHVRLLPATLQYTLWYKIVLCATMYISFLLTGYFWSGLHLNVEMSSHVMCVLRLLSHTCMQMRVCEGRAATPKLSASGHYPSGRAWCAN